MSEHFIIAGCIFVAAALSSSVANALYYAMYDHRPAAAAVLSFVREVLTWGISLFIIGDLLMNRSPWTVLYVLADALGDAWRTWADCRRHCSYEIPPD